MYGQATDLKNKSVWFRAKVYKIADEMLIASLVKELESSFVGTTAPGIFSLFDLYRFLGNKLGIDACKEVTL
jgi:hypothetical protein